MPRYPLDLMRTTGERINYEARGAIQKLWKCKDPEILVAGPARTGKSRGILEKVHLALSKYPNAKGLMARKTRTSMTNSCIDMFERFVLKPPDRVHFQKTDQQFQYPNGSMLAIIGLDEATRIMSTEFDIAYIQEATECTEADWEIVVSRLSSFVMPYQQIIGDCNPDKPTHWLKKRCDLGKTTMLESVHQDNPRFFMKNGRPTRDGLVYMATLDRLSGTRRQRLYLGNWVAAEGMVYEAWDPNIHMVHRDSLPIGWDKWPHYWAIDWGHVHPFVWQDWIQNPYTHELYRLHEIYKTGWLVEDLARYIKKKYLPHNYPKAVICDHDAEDRKVFERHCGVLTMPAYKSIQSGVQAVQARISPEWSERGPGLFLIRDALDTVDKDLEAKGWPTCTEKEIDGYVWDKKHNLDINSKKDELPVDKDNHGMDAKRYMVAFIDSIADDPEEFEEIIELADDVEVRISRY